MVFIIVNRKLITTQDFRFRLLRVRCTNQTGLNTPCKIDTWEIHKNNGKAPIYKNQNNFTLNGLYPLIFLSIWSAMCYKIDGKKDSGLTDYINSSHWNKGTFSLYNRINRTYEITKACYGHTFWVNSNWDQYLAQHLMFQKCDKWVNTNLLVK